MSDSTLRDKSKEFAKSIVFLCRELKNRKVESVLINQLLRCGTSVGANIFEGKYAQGCKDLISKFEIALKEINESEYWLELIYETGGHIHRRNKQTKIGLHKHQKNACCISKNNKIKRTKMKFVLSFQ